LHKSLLDTIEQVQDDNNDDVSPSREADLSMQQPNPAVKQSLFDPHSQRMKKIVVLVLVLVTVGIVLGVVIHRTARQCTRILETSIS